MMNKLSLGTKVYCTAYLKPVKDGAFIAHNPAATSNDHREHYLLYYSNRAGKAYSLDTINSTTEIDESPCEGARDIEKTYYERIERKFSGYVIGQKDVVVTGYLGVDTDTAFDGREYQRVFKEAKEIVSCAVIAYGMNRKRYVPIEDLKEAHDER